MLEENVRHHGTFLLHGQEVWGELVLSGADTKLRLRTEKLPAKSSTPEVIHGQLHDFTLVSCIQCVGGDMPSQSSNSKGERSWSWSVFPHQVLSGRSHFNPGADRIRKVWFSVGDIYQIFDDFDSFGTLVAPAAELQSSLPRIIGNRHVPIGTEPRIVYFAGRCVLLEASLSFGKLEVQHWPIAVANSHGAHINNQMRIHIEFEPAIDLEECLSKVAEIGQFLSLVAGRTQEIENVGIAMEGRDSNEVPLSLYSSFSPKQTNEQDLDTPSWRDMPLDGVRRMDEFRKVTEQWFFSNNHALARARLHSCREAGNYFNVDRLVAAANMFDLTSTLTPKDVPERLAKVRDDCLAALRALPRCDDRDSAIMALSRIGAPTLMKKVLSRAAILRGHFILEDLDKVLRHAVKCRNHFVHGPGDKGFNYEAVEHHVHFFTETLEFVFAAAELIECGWAAGDWRLRPHTSHHWFSRFISDYSRACQQLLSDIETAKFAKLLN